VPKLIKDLESKILDETLYDHSCTLGCLIAFKTPMHLFLNAIAFVAPKAFTYPYKKVVEVLS
jgi:hypothetical protein